jgi:hypothetical protein
MLCWLCCCVLSSCFRLSLAPQSHALEGGLASPAAAAAASPAPAAASASSPKAVRAPSSVSASAAAPAPSSAGDDDDSSAPAMPKDVVKVVTFGSIDNLSTTALNEFTSGMQKFVSQISHAIQQVTGDVHLTVPEVPAHLRYSLLRRWQPIM